MEIKISVYLVNEYVIMLRSSVSLNRIDPFYLLMIVEFFGFESGS